jgi:uncharacterized iron-regulated membrane protein
MRFHYVVRKVHAWGLILVVVPLLVIGITGTLLQLKKQLAWVQPKEHVRAGSLPSLGLEAILDKCRATKEAQIATWADVERIDIRPSRGLIKVTSVSAWEIQMDAATGQVLSSAKRLSDVIEALHDGSWFGKLTKFAIFLPAGVVLCVGASSGLYLFGLPLTRRFNRWRRSRESPSGRSRGSVDRLTMR